MDQKALAALLFPDVTETPEDLEARYPARDLPEGAVVTRMAPSPTGFVHLGNLVQGLVAERMAHQSGGVLFLRVEDTDAKREVPGAVEVLINTLKHYGIHFDEGATIDGDSGAYGPYRQRQRAAIYHVYAKQLVLQGDAYPCFCTEEELTAMRAEQEAKKVNFGYYGEYAVWRDRPIEDVESAIAAGKPWVLRFRSTGSIENKFKYSDLVKGTLTVTENDIDQVLLKSDGIPTYHFAHAVDDHLMRTTHVVRGDEWLPSLPFHLQLFRALGFRIPKETIALTNKAYDLGIELALIVCPFYNKPTQEGLYLHYKTIAENTKANIMLYNIPIFVGVNLEAETVGRLAAIPNIVGVKDEAGVNPTQVTDFFLATEKVDPNFVVYNGDDIMLLPTIVQGAMGIVSGGAHIFGHEIRAIFEAFEKGENEKAKELFVPMYRFCKTTGQNGRILPNSLLRPAIEAVTGIKLGPARLPLAPATEAELDVTLGVLRELGKL